MSRRRTTGIAGAIAIVTLTGALLAAGSLVVTEPAGNAVTRTTTASGCGVFPDLLALEHVQAPRREATLTGLVAVLRARRDPFGLNAGQISTLQVANASVQALDQQISTHCYGSRNKLIADIATLYNTYRVYWLRLPQTQVIAAADYLGDARARLGAAATTLAGTVGANTRARTDLAAMNQALAAADGKLGRPPAAAAPIDAVSRLQPAVDMAADTNAINAARANLLAARDALNTARAAGLRVVADLGG